MELKVVRFYSDSDSTMGCLTVDGKFQCWTVEDEHRDIKVKGETRIPAGTYEVKFRESDSPMTLKYRQRYPFFKYHLWLQDVPNFEWVYIHTGNNDDHTDGCLIVGNGINPDNMTVLSSRDAYSELYPMIQKALESGESVYITYVDADL